MNKLTRFGLQIPSFTYPGDGDRDDNDQDRGFFDQVAAIASTAEASGFDSLWVMDHFFQIPQIGEPDEPMFEAYTLLGGLAARTRTARLGALVTGVTYRNPALLAKAVTALDVLSSGRAVLGLGAAWFDSEHEALGFDFPSLTERFARLDEALRICRAMFTEDAPSFEGAFYNVKNAVNRPCPVQLAGPPILVGGGGERRTLRLVAEQADACNIFGDVETVRHKLAVLDGHCEAVGRDPFTVTKTRLGSLVIADTQVEADRQVEELASQRGQDVASLRSTMMVGDPDRVVEQAAALFEAGLDGLIFNMPLAHHVDLVALAGSTLTGAFGGPDHTT